MVRLVVTEKNTSAKRIAEILSGRKLKMEKTYNLPVYTFKLNGTEVRCLGLRGHILKVDFPEDYRKWEEVEPKSLINATLIKVPTHKQVIKALRKEAKNAQEIIVATDFDREGELIGFDVSQEVMKVNPSVKIKRARFSALTQGEIQKAFQNLEEPYVDLAQAGEARQDIDLIWGATLTRFISLASSRLGKQFLSVGRVQSPTLCILAQREKEIKEFKPRPYWQVKVELESQAGDRFWAQHRQERFWDEKEAKRVVDSLPQAGRVSEVQRVEREIPPPAPFNTTSLLTAAASRGLAPARAMRLAENLYMQGYISYPRVDNTVYPKTLDLKELLKVLSKHEDYNHITELLLKKSKLTPTRGKKMSTDHPPIHPTEVPDASQLRPGEWRLFDLVARRFLATLSDSAVGENTRVFINLGEEIFTLKGHRLLKEGWMLPYPFNRRKEEELPALRKGEEVKLVQVKLEEKETQPPPRYTQGRLIKEMENLGLGTKATRHQIIQNLYERSYITGDPIILTELGLAVAKTLIEHMTSISTPKMTAELEKEMDAIAEGEKAKREVVDHSRDMLASVMNLLETKRKEVGSAIRAGLNEDKVVGDCPSCGGQLKIIRSKKSGKRFVGCSNFPGCRVSFPLPQRGEIVASRALCQSCNSPLVKVLNKKRKPWELCINPACPGKAEKGA
jgi:DNA topoisomerase-1